MNSPQAAFRIRAAEPADAAALSALIGSEGVFEGTTQLPLMPVASRLERFSHVDPVGLLLVACVIDAQGETLVGMVGLHGAGAVRRAHVRSLGIAVAKAWQGQGVGDALMRQAIEWADQWAGVLRIELTVHADNQRAIALYERHGFVKEGLMPGYIMREGRYVAAHAMARWHPRPPALA
jgi:L-phenylalanine/L-methionine N-acetyltransferase